MYLFLATAEFSMTWIELAKGGIGGVFLVLFVWLVAFQIPKMHADLMCAEDKFTESVGRLMVSFRTEQEAAREAFRREQDAVRRASAVHNETLSTAFESALREICDRAERSELRMLELFRETVLKAEEKGGA